MEMEWRRLRRGGGNVTFKKRQKWEKRGREKEGRSEGGRRVPFGRKKTPIFS